MEERKNEAQAGSVRVALYGSSLLSLKDYAAQDFRG